MEEAVLRVRVSGGVGKIDAIRGLDGGYTERIALDMGGVNKAGSLDTAFQPGKRGTKPEVQDCERQQDRQAAGRSDAATAAQSSVTFRICSELVPPSTPDSSPLVSTTRSPRSTSCNSSSFAKMER